MTDKEKIKLALDLIEFLLEDERQYNRLRLMRIYKQIKGE